jgi:hypothetical protein
MLRTHLFRVFTYVAVFFWVAFVWGGLTVLSAPDSGKGSHLAGWTILVIAAAVMIGTMSHWVKYLQVILGGGILGGLLVIAQGHLFNGERFPRMIAAGLTAALIGCSLISQTFANRSLRISDRIALVSFVAAFASGMIIGTPIWGLVSVSVGFGCLFAAWLYNRLSPTSDPIRRTCHS